MSTPPITLVLADDHPIVLNGLQQLFADEPDFKILASCADGEASLDAVRRQRPDILVLDLQMPRKSGLTVLRELHEERLPTRIVVLTASLAYLAAEDDQLTSRTQRNVMTGRGGGPARWPTCRAAQRTSPNATTSN